MNVKPKSITSNYYYHKLCTVVSSIYKKMSSYKLVSKHKVRETWLKTDSSYSLVCSVCFHNCYSCSSMSQRCRWQISAKFHQTIFFQPKLQRSLKFWLGEFILVFQTCWRWGKLMGLVRKLDMSFSLDYFF